MPEDTTKPESAAATTAASAVTVTAPQPGPVSQWLSGQGFEHAVLEPDHLGVEVLGVEAPFLPVIAAALKASGFDYLQCQGGYDEGPGGQLVSFYHLVKLAALADQSTASQHLPAAARPSGEEPPSFGHTVTVTLYGGKKREGDSRKATPPARWGGENAADHSVGKAPCASACAELVVVPSSGATPGVRGGVIASAAPPHEAPTL